MECNNVFFCSRVWLSVNLTTLPSLHCHLIKALNLRFGCGCDTTAIVSVVSFS